MMFNELAAEFPREAIHWRAQTLTGTGDKALALAYLDARDVMDRFDAVCGPANWSDSYVETIKGRLICTIAVRIDGEWVSKSDGAGDTDVEGEKGALSDALKRAAVKWGVGRYLYRLPSVWAPCTTYEKNGKKYWKAWNGSPWDHVRGAPPSPVRAVSDAPALIESVQRMITDIGKCGTQTELRGWLRKNKPVTDLLSEQELALVVGAYEARKAELPIEQRQAA